MIRAILRRKATTWAILLGCGFALVRCGHEQIAGSSVTTGNPTEIRVGFTGESGPVAVAGRVEVYAATQIPIPGFQPEPLARHDFNGTEFRLTAGHLEGIADSLWTAGSKVGDSLARFNLVFTGDKQGAILRDLAFRLKEGRFTLNEGTFTAGKGTEAKVSLAVSDLAVYRASLPAGSLIDRKDHFLFLSGTGYYAKGDSDRFVFPPMPGGTYNPLLVSIPTKESQAQSPQDSATLYGLDKPLATSENPSNFTDEQGRIRIPDSLR